MLYSHFCTFLHRVENVRCYYIEIENKPKFNQTFSAENKIQTRSVNVAEFAVSPASSLYHSQNVSTPVGLLSLAVCHQRKKKN